MLIFQSNIPIDLLSSLQSIKMTARYTATTGKKDALTIKADFGYLQQNNYDVKKEIDRGSYGVVYKAEDKNTGGIVAIKINFNIISKEQQYIEIGLLKIMRDYTRLPFLHTVIQKKDSYSIIMDYHKSKPFITFFSKFKIVDVKHYIYELLLGLSQLKELGIHHRDIKPSNFLYDQEQKRGVIIDFGLAEVNQDFVKSLIKQVQKLKKDDDIQYTERSQVLEIYQNIQKCIEQIGKNKIGTQIFMPPQSILRMEKQEYSSDIWPVGIILLQFASKRYNIFSTLPKLQQYFKLDKNGFVVSYLLQLGSLFGKEKVIDVCEKVFGYELILPQCLRQVNLRQICIMDQFDNIAFDLLLRLLELNPANRISVEDALQHAFFEGISKYHTQ